MEILKDFALNTLAVIVGGLIVFNIARWPFAANEISAMRNNEVLLRENIARIRKELRNNLKIVSELNRPHDQRERSKADFKWEKNDVNSISFFSFNYLINSGLNTMLPTPLESYIFESYNELEKLSNLYKTAFKADNLYAEAQALQEAANNELLSVEINQIRTRLEAYIKKIEEFNL